MADLTAQDRADLVLRGFGVDDWPAVPAHDLRQGGVETADIGQVLVRHLLDRRHGVDQPGATAWFTAMRQSAA